LWKLSFFKNWFFFFKKKIRATNSSFQNNQFLSQIDSQQLITSHCVVVKWVRKNLNSMCWLRKFVPTTHRWTVNYSASVYRVDTVWRCVCSRRWLSWFVGCGVTDDSFVQFIDALKVNTTLTAINLGGTFKLFHVSLLLIIISGHWLTIFMLNYLFRNWTWRWWCKVYCRRIESEHNIEVNFTSSWHNFSVFVLIFQKIIFVFSLLGNAIGDAGVSYIAEALKVNNILIKIVFWGEQMVFRFRFKSFSQIRFCFTKINR